MKPIGRPPRAFAPPSSSKIARPAAADEVASAHSFAFSPFRKVMLASGAESGFVSRIPYHLFSMLDRIESLRPKMRSLSDSRIKKTMGELKARRARGASLKSLVPEAFALIREASRRVLGKEHREVQLLAGMALVDRAVAQLRTGEGKTLVAALAASLFALDGKGCHVATTNGYLAERDANELTPLYEMLGLTVGVSRSLGQTSDDKRSAYAADITYAHADTLGFDWLDDQLIYRPEWRMQRGLAYAIVDEADDVLLDTAEQPMVLCSQPESDDQLAARRSAVRLAEEIARELDPQRDLRLSYKRERWSPHLSEEGVAHLELLIARRLAIAPRDVWSPSNAALIHQVLKALEAEHSVRQGEAYIGDPEKVVLVSATTGHAQPGSRLRHGLMDAVLHKEGREIERELLPVGQITYQSYFNMYGQLSGMTGTARGGRTELKENYELKVIEVPPHLPPRRVDLPDLFFPHPAPRLLAAIADAIERHASGQPVLISTTSVTESKEVSERLADPVLLLADVAVSSERLFDEALRRLPEPPKPKPQGARARRSYVRERFAEHPAAARAFAELLESKGLPAVQLLSAEKGLDHRLLNAETEAEEAAIIARAGERGAITVATQMAGRGTDIGLGEDVEELGGLHVISIGHKANRRKDEQAIGRAGRHGERGSSRFYVAPTDAVFSFLPAREMRALCARLGADEIRQPEGALVRAFQRAIAKAQDRAENELAYARMINTRYDSFIHRLRLQLIAEREEVLEANDLPELVHTWLKADLSRAISEPGDAVRTFFRELDPTLAVPERSSPRELEALLTRTLDALIERKKEARGEADGAFRQYIRDMFLYTMDQAWTAYLDGKDDLRRQAVLEMHRDGNPYVEFAKSASVGFRELGEHVRREIMSRYRFHLRITP
jgi:preprotein translocase subunit SecA